MTSLMIGRIYKIVSPNTHKIYVGSTFETLPQRFRHHTYDWRNGIACSVKEILDAGDSNIELLEEVEVESKAQLRIKEQEWAEKLCNIIVNKNKAFSTLEQTKQKRNDNNKERYKTDPEYREKQILYMRKYHETNKEEHNEYNRIKEFCEVCKNYTNKGKMKRHKASKKHLQNLKSQSSDV
jgi:flagellar biosynthesis/type III secretory pathway chaperone